MRVTLDLPTAWGEAIQVIAQREHRPPKWQIMRMIWEGMKSRLDEAEGDIYHDQEADEGGEPHE
jgi:hypothetical protein